MWVKKVKFNKKCWEILDEYIGGWQGELHSFVSGHKEEYLSTLKPLSMIEHRGRGHKKNWPVAKYVPTAIQEDNLKFWKELLSEEDLNWFKSNGFWKP